MKAVTHHTTPQKQFLYTHHLEALPGDYSSFNNDKLTAEDCEPVSSLWTLSIEAVPSFPA